MDTLNNFIVGSSNGDVLDFTALGIDANSSSNIATSTNVLEDDGNAFTSNDSALSATCYR